MQMADVNVLKMFKVDNEDSRAMQSITSDIHLMKVSNRDTRTVHVMISRCRSGAATRSKLECFVIIVNGFQPLSQSTPSWMLQQA